ncbi:MAG: TatD family hydrolase, partial [Sphingomonadales bacterium]|nr:TatD family hydrolase [Sphingomonadales bacterium]
GKTCEPGFVVDTARFLADLRGESVETLADYTTRNFHALFDKTAQKTTA